MAFKNSSVDVCSAPGQHHVDDRHSPLTENSNRISAGRYRRRRRSSLVFMRFGAPAFHYPTYCGRDPILLDSYREEGEAAIPHVQSHWNATCYFSLEKLWSFC
jgi:hypothetical protein